MVLTPSLRPGSGPIRRLLGASLLALIASLCVTSPALAHAELRQSSPAAGETVGGDFHQIAMQFIGLDVNAPQDAQLYDPAGSLIESTLASEGQRLVIPIEPLQVPGEYTVRYATNGIDGDYIEESFSFRYEPGAPEPSGITIALAGEQGFDFLGFALLLVAAALAAFLVQRFLVALKAHRAAQAAAAPRNSNSP